MPNRPQDEVAFLHTGQFMELSSDPLHVEERNGTFGEIYRLTRTTIENHREAEERKNKRLRLDLTTET